MNPSDPKPGSAPVVSTPDSHAVFARTRWSLVISAQQGNSAAADAALARLCEIYWYPIYAFLRRKGHSKHEAEDLTQGFFAHVLRREWLKNVGPEKGRFRTFVLRCLTNFVLNQPKLPSTIPLDFSCADDRYTKEPVDNVTPEQLFELRWAASVLERALAQVRQEYIAAGKNERYEALLPYLTKETAPGPFATVAMHLGMSPEAARQETRRLRERFREAINGEIAESVSGAEEVAAERQYLLGIFAR